MARGIANNEPTVSQANNDAFRAGYERALGDAKPTRGRWVYDVRLKCCVPADEYEPPARALDAPVMVDRFMEGDRSPDGVDIGSRRKRKDWMRAADVVDHGDFKGAREQRRKMLAERAELLKTGKPTKPDRELRDLIGRELYKRKMIL